MIATLEQVKRIYTGRPGCMCGCRGKYTAPSNKNKAAIARVFNEVMNNPDVKYDASAKCFYVQTETRVKAVYLVD